MARDISELGADVFDDTPQPKRRISIKKRNYIIGLSVAAALVIGAAATSIILCNTVLLDYANVQNVYYYFATGSTLAEGEEPYAVLYHLRSDVKYPSTFYIPNQINGYKVVGVSDHAFENHEEIKHVVFSNNVKWIGENVFNNCTKLSKFTWNKNLSEVGVDAFNNTAFYNKLLQNKKVLYELPSGLLIYVGQDYFDANTALISDKISDAEVNEVKAKYGAKNIKKFSELKISNIASGAFRNNDKICFIDLPEAVKKVSNSTFESCGRLQGLDMSHSLVSSVKAKAFKNCSALTDITLTNSIVEIGSEAFSGTGLVDSIPNIFTSEEVVLGEGIFSECQELESANWGGDYVPKNTFNGCSSLKEIKWGTNSNADKDDLKSIGAGAFAGTAFETFEVPKNIELIDEETFKGCTSLKKVSLYGNPNYLSDPYDEDVPEDERNSFYNPTTGEMVQANIRGLKYISALAFDGCTSLKTIDLYDDNYSYLKGNENEFTFPGSLYRTDTFISSYDNFTFGETSATKVTFTANTEAIGTYAFSNCKDLTEVAIENIDHSQLADILYGAFIDCSNLTTFKLPKSLVNLETSAFENCTSLHDIDLENTSITIINPNTFYNCQNLEASKLPNTVTSIWSDAFYRNYAMDYLIVPNSINEVQNNSVTEARNNGSKMPVYFEFTVAEAKSVNFGSRWKDDTVQDYYFLADGEEKQTGYHYWKYNGSGVPEVID